MPHCKTCKDIKPFALFQVPMDCPDCTKPKAKPNTDKQEAEDCKQCNGSMFIATFFGYSPCQSCTPTIRP